MSEKILIIDDDHSLLRLSQMILKRKGYDAVIAVSSMEAKKILSSGKEMDLMVLDLMMPDEDGIDFLKWLSEQPAPMKDTPVILNTAKNLTDTEIGFFQNKCEKIILKGMNFTENLLSEVDAVLSSK